MDLMAKRYLEELTKQLRPVPEAERQDAVREIESHIADALGAGQPTVTVLARLGEPNVLAKAYLADFHLQRSGGLRVGFQKFSFFATTSLTSLLVVPFLGFFIAASGFITALAPFALVMRLLGQSGFMVANGGPMPIPMAIPTAIGLFIVGALLTRWFLRLTQRYFRFVASGYKSLQRLTA